jgi:hypothetical protein
VDTSDWELKTSTAGSALCLSLDFASFTASRHDDDDDLVEKKSMIDQMVCFRGLNGRIYTPGSTSYQAHYAR